MDYHTKLTIKRELNEIKDLDNSIESDRGRIVSAPALRRLQKRTQVFPLELNAAVRTRLTHSIEVSQVARYISKTIIKKTNNSSLRELENAFISTAEMSSLLHDIGNPPFGHFAEMCINDWMSKNGTKIFNKLYNISDKYIGFKDMLLRDICNFDGNAQAIRVISKLQRLNLSYMQIASVLKYTRGAYEDSAEPSNKYSYLKKKPGFYYSEKELIDSIYSSLNMNDGCRFPITYIMEAADDISYINADIEDAVDKDLMSFDDIYTIIESECKSTQNEYLLNIIQKYYSRVKKREQEPYQFNLFLTLTRAKITNDLVNYVADVYIDNHKSIFDGSFNNALLEYDKNNKYTKTINLLRDISKKHIYSHKDIQSLELKGYKILTGLLNSYKPLLKLTQVDFGSLISKKDISCFISTRLIKRLSTKHIVAYQDSINKLDKKNKQKFQIQEWYYRARLILDYISGMTDDFALSEYRWLSAK
jgi:dGTPase